MIKTETHPDGMVSLRPIGDLDWSNAGALGHAVHNVLTPFVRVEIDLEHVVSVDAVGITRLLRSVRLIRSIAGEVQVTKVPAAVQSRLDLLGIDLRFIGTSRPGEAA